MAEQDREQSLREELTRRVCEELRVAGWSYQIGTNANALEPQEVGVPLSGNLSVCIYVYPTRVVGYGGYKHHVRHVFTSAQINEIPGWIAMVSGKSLDAADAVDAVDVTSTIEHALQGLGYQRVTRMKTPGHVEFATERGLIGWAWFEPGTILPVHAKVTQMDGEGRWHVTGELECCSVPALVQWLREECYTPEPRTETPPTEPDAKKAELLKKVAARLNSSDWYTARDIRDGIPMIVLQFPAGDEFTFCCVSPRHVRGDGPRGVTALFNALALNRIPTWVKECHGAETPPTEPDSALAVMDRLGLRDWGSWVGDWYVLQEAGLHYDFKPPHPTRGWLVVVAYSGTDRVLLAGWYDTVTELVDAVAAAVGEHRVESLERLKDEVADRLRRVAKETRRLWNMTTPTWWLRGTDNRVHYVEFDRETGRATVVALVNGIRTGALTTHCADEVERWIRADLAAGGAPETTPPSPPRDRYAGHTAQLSANRVEDPGVRVAGPGPIGTGTTSRRRALEERWTSNLYKTRPCKCGAMAGCMCDPSRTK